jgi:hypothetical protein
MMYLIEMTLKRYAIRACGAYLWAIKALKRGPRSLSEYERNELWW